MLDLHVLLYHNNAEWNTQCRSTIAEAVGNAPFAVDVHYLQGEEGHIGRGRARGYSLGVHPYVTYVDHDDFLLSDALSALSDVIHQDYDAIFPAELELQNGFVRAGVNRHHLCLYKRHVLIDHSKYVACGDLLQSMYLRIGKSIEIPQRGYVHRIYESAGRHLRRANVEEYKGVISG